MLLAHVHSDSSDEISNQTLVGNKSDHKEVDNKSEHEEVDDKGSYPTQHSSGSLARLSTLTPGLMDPTTVQHLVDSNQDPNHDESRSHQQCQQPTFNTISDSQERRNDVSEKALSPSSGSLAHTWTHDADSDPIKPPPSSPILRSLPHSTPLPESMNGPKFPRPIPPSRRGEKRPFVEDAKYEDPYEEWTATSGSVSGGE